MRILLLGRTGQLGWELLRTLAPLGEITAPPRSACDLGDPETLRRAVRGSRPDVIVNAAAYTAVDRAEAEREAAFAVNAHAPAALAEEAQRLGALLVHYSTDYVFDGGQRGPYREDDTAHPLNVYGESKLTGEQAIAASGCRHLTLRTSWIYSARGANFFLTLRRMAAEPGELRVVADQYGAPNWSRPLAEATASILARGPLGALPSGIYHLSARGRTSWHGYAQAILELLRVDRTVTPIRTSEFPRPARRPANSALDTGKIERELGIVLPDWREMLARCAASLSG